MTRTMPGTRCPSCEAVNNLSRKFCRQCGASLQQAEPKPKTATSPADIRVALVGLGAAAAGATVAARINWRLAAVGMLAGLCVGAEAEDWIRDHTEC